MWVGKEFAKYFLQLAMIKTAFIRLTKGSLIYGLGGVLQRFMGLLLLPFFTQVLTPEDYGVVALISLIGVAMSGLLSLGTGNSMGLLYYREKDHYKRPTIIWTNLLLLVVNGLIWYVIIFFLAPTLSDLVFQTERYTNLIRLYFLGTVFATITDPWLAYLRMEERAKKYVILTLISSLISILLSIYLVLFMEQGVMGLVLALVIANGLMFLITGATVGRYLSFRLDINLFSPLVRIGFPSIFGLFAFLLIDYADRQMIERMVSLSALGIYSLGYSFGMVIMIATNAFATAWPPFFMSYINKPEEARKVFARVLTYYVIGFSILSVFFFFIAQPIIFFMTAPAFHQAWTVVGLIAAGYALKGCYLIILPGIYFANKLYLQSIIEWAAAIINIGLNLLLIPIYGFVGAALATLISYLCLSILTLIVARRYLAVDYQWRRLGLVTVIVVFFNSIIFINSASHFSEIRLSLITNFGIIIVFCLVVYKFILSVKERELIRTKLRV